MGGGKLPCGGIKSKTMRPYQIPHASGIKLGPINPVLTSAILTVTIAHHAFALEGAARPLVPAANPFDTHVGVFLKHVRGTWHALPV